MHRHYLLTQCARNFVHNIRGAYEQLRYVGADIFVGYIIMWSSLRLIPIGMRQAVSLKCATPIMSSTVIISAV